MLRLSRIRPERILALMVLFGRSEHERHLPVGVAAKARQFDGLALLAGQVHDGLSDLVADVQVPGLVLEVVAAGGHFGGAALFSGLAGGGGAHQVHRAIVGHR